MKIKAIHFDQKRIEQLLEPCNKLDFSETLIRKISINKANAEELDRHPYLNRWQANSIVKMRIPITKRTSEITFN
jgi:DNA uptake protein ComE-like DNA-binding protein